MKTKVWKFILILSDLVSGIFSWFCFFYLRQEWIEKKEFNVDSNFLIGLFILPLFWILFYFIQGTYHDVRRHFRIKIFNLTIVASILGTIALFFTLILDDNVKSYRDYYQLFFLLFGIPNESSSKTNPSQA
jgi:FlaA1/EpsC-like NDP-sugar epimerase